MTARDFSRNNVASNADDSIVYLSFIHPGAILKLYAGKRYIISKKKTSKIKSKSLKWSIIRCRAYTVPIK